MKKLKIPNEKISKNLDKIRKGIYIGLLLLLMFLIYQVSPRITATIQNMAKYLYELDSVYITRFVEIFLVVVCVLPIGFTYKGGEK